MPKTKPDPLRPVLISHPDLLTLIGSGSSDKDGRAQQAAALAQEFKAAGMTPAFPDNYGDIIRQMHADPSTRETMLETLDALKTKHLTSKHAGISFATLLEDISTRNARIGHCLNIFDHNGLEITRLDNKAKSLIDILKRKLPDYMRTKDRRNHFTC